MQFALLWLSLAQAKSYLNRTKHANDLNNFTDFTSLKRLNDTKSCSARGGCSCDCSWAPKDCGGDDGTCCYACCCNAPPKPGPTPNPGTCKDFSVDEGKDCSGNDLSNSPAVDTATCCSLCSENSGCEAFTWSQYDGSGQKQATCYLKSGCPSKVPSSDCNAGSKSGPTPPGPSPPPSPSPSPPTPPPPSPTGATLYCPNSNDWSVEYGTANFQDSGWSITGGARVRSKASFNLLGGYVEFDMNTAGAKSGVNNNFYLTSPTRQNFPNYCDIQQNPGCLELDIVENNGNCVTQTTWHTTPIGKGNCDRGGCEGNTAIPSGGHFHIKTAFATNGWMTVTMDGNEIAVTNPTPDNDARDYVRETLSSIGGFTCIPTTHPSPEALTPVATISGMIHSSQWTGWVPGGNCGGGGGLGDSTFAVSNVRVLGIVVQGDTPTKC